MAAIQYLKTLMNYGLLLVNILSGCKLIHFMKIKSTFIKAKLCMNQSLKCER